MPEYVIDINSKLDKALREYLNEDSPQAVTNEIHAIILAELEWNLKKKISDILWDFTVIPINEGNG